MNLKEILPHQNRSEPDESTQEFLRGIIMRINFVPAIRYHLGWRGVKEVTGTHEAWTMKIEGYKGVFGLFLANAEELSHSVKGSFTIFYFPSPEEEMVEKLSVKAGIITQQENYLEKVRSFTTHPELTGLFSIGTLALSAHHDGDWCSIEAETLQRLRLVNNRGIYLVTDGRKKEIVSPGDLEQDLPVLDLVHSLFDLMASSLSSLLGKPPARYSVFLDTGFTSVLEGDGSIKEMEDSDNQRLFFRLDWGKNYPELTREQPDILWEGKESPPDPEARWWEAHRIHDASSLDKKTLGIDDRPELIVLSGFLGSGKTTFLNHFIEVQQQYNRFTAVIQNELGEKGVDAYLLENDYAVMELDEGCVCCSLVGPLKSGIKQLLGEFHPDYIILETTGVANPANLLDEIIEIGESVRFDSVTTVVDAGTIRESLKRYKVSKEQIRVADVIILNKVDGLDEAEIDAIRKILREYNPKGPIIPAIYGEVNPSLLYSRDKDIPEKPAFSGENKHHTHDMDGLESFTINLEKGMNKEILAHALDHLPVSVFRVKGLVDLKDEGAALVQYVSGRYEISKHESDVVQPFLTVIGREVRNGIDRTGFKNLFLPSLHGESLQ